MGEDHIQFRRIRPRIRVQLPLKEEDIVAGLKTALDAPDSSCEGTAVKGFASIFPRKEEQHFWSPQLTLIFEAVEQGTLLRGLYGPQPTVWTMFVFVYVVLGFSSVMALLMGLSYWSLGKVTFWLWLSPLLSVLILSMYAVAYSGQKLGQKQMTRLHRFIESVFGQEIEVE